MFKQCEVLPPIFDGISIFAKTFLGDNFAIWFKERFSFFDALYYTASQWQGLKKCQFDLLHNQGSLHQKCLWNSANKLPQLRISIWISKDISICFHLPWAVARSLEVWTAVTLYQQHWLDENISMQLQQSFEFFHLTLRHIRCFTTRHYPRWVPEGD